jgi:hypothetical protein
MQKPLVSTASILLCGALWAAACGSSGGGVYGALDGGADGSAGSGGAAGGAAGAGGSGTSCESDGDCAALGQRCFEDEQRCVECLESSDCESGQKCHDHACAEFCKNSLDCEQGTVCDEQAGVCVECVDHPDCPPEERCVANQCIGACDSDKDCTPFGMLCDVASGTCVPPGSGGTSGAGGAGGTAGAGQGGEAGGGAGGTGGSSAGAGGTGGSSAGAGGGGTGGGGGCGMLDIVLLFDHSGSMQDTAAGGMTKWSAAVQSFDAWASAASDVRVALHLHPRAPSMPPPSSCTTDQDCGPYGPCLVPFNTCQGAFGNDTSCLASDYETADIALALLPGAASAFQSALAAQQPAGGSPHRPALEGALGAARTLAQQNPTGRTVVAFMADGDPTACTPPSGDVWAPIAAAAAAGLSGTPSVPTHVIAISPTTTGFDAVAQSGGTGAAIALPGADVGNALATIQATYACP